MTESCLLLLLAFFLAVIFLVGVFVGCTGGFFIGRDW